MSSSSEEERDELLRRKGIHQTRFSTVKIQRSFEETESSPCGRIHPSIVILNRPTDFDKAGEILNCF